MTVLKYTAVAAVVTIASATRVSAQTSYKHEISDSLLKHTKITEAAAAKTAQARVPKGAIQAVELEREKGKLMYSYDIKTAGKSGIDEVNVDAVTGKIIGFSHETPADEQKEAAEDAKAAKAKAKKP